MIQEIITYVIVALAIGMAVYKSYKKLKRKKLLKQSDGKIGSSTSQSACSNCIADCILRNASTEIKNENAQLCEKSIEKLKCS
ncbi:hypothetical protein [Mariniphaga sp.]|uniref:hypothetical protein n=1 Tax=Mariniphaga sp. TaxID=1954475 RepID=UPI003566C4C4